jgi:VCBS repeat-containing protein
VSTGGLCANDPDADSDVLTARLMSGPSHGSLTLHDDGTFDYAPAAGFHGADQFTYRAVDGHAFSEVTTVSVTVNSVNDAPVALDDSYHVHEGAVLNVILKYGVLANDTDPDNEDSDPDNNDQLTMVLDTDVSHGSLTFGGGGWIQYIPDRDFFGTDSFTYRASDGESLSEEATVVIEVSPSLPGDADRNGVVDAEDAALVAQYWGRTDAWWEMGDFDRDGRVGLRDAAILAANWGARREEAFLSAIPEPGAFTLLAALIMASVVIRRRGAC